MKTIKKAKTKLHVDEDSLNTLKTSVHTILTEVGENPKREGLEKTPERYAKALKFLTSGYETDPVAVLKKALFHEDYSEMVIVKNIELFSMCEHHMLPFYGKAHVAYVPKGKIVGLSKIPRVVDIFARRLQVQERLTDQIAKTVFEVLKPYGVGVVIEANHMCMMMRGVEKQGSSTLTSCMLGTFRDDKRTRQEFLSLLHRPGI